MVTGLAGFVLLKRDKDSGRQGDTPVAALNYALFPADEEEE